MSLASEQAPSLWPTADGKSRTIRFISLDGKKYRLDVKSDETLRFTIDYNTLYVDGSHGSLPERVRADPDGFSLAPDEGNAMVSFDHAGVSDRHFVVSPETPVFVRPVNSLVPDSLPVLVWKDHGAGGSVSSKASGSLGGLKAAFLKTHK